MCKVHGMWCFILFIKLWSCFHDSSESESRSVTADSLLPWTVHGILQARTLERAAFPFSRGSSQARDQTQVSALQADSLPTEL